MIRFLLPSLLILWLSVAGSAWAQESQVFDFDYDQQGNSTSVTLPAQGSAAPITAPARPADQKSPTPPPAVPKPTAAPKPSAAPNPAGAPETKKPDNVIVLVGEPDPVAETPPPLSDDELFDLFAAPETEPGLPTADGRSPAAAVTAEPTQARVEKSPAPAAVKKDQKPPTAPRPAEPQRQNNAAKPSREPVPAQPSADRAAAKAAEDSASKAVVTLSHKAEGQAKPAASAVRRGNQSQRRWVLGQKAWSLVGRIRAGSPVSGRRLYPLDQAGPPLAPAGTAPRPASVRRTGTARPVVVELTRFP